MNEILQNILTRRSIRKYKAEQILDTELDAIIEATKYAPSGGNSQSWHFTVVQNQEKLQQFDTRVRETFKAMMVDETKYRSKIAGEKAVT